jgi:hypothetical protein
MTDETLDALADLFRCGWTARDMTRAFPWLDTYATYDAWNRIPIMEQVRILHGHGAGRSVRGAVRMVVVPPYEEEPQ